jgi:hypothetical protein
MGKEYLNSDVRGTGIKLDKPQGAAAGKIVVDV